MSKKNGKGMGELRPSDLMDPKVSVFGVLKDKQWHSYKEIRQKTNLSNPALSKQLEQIKLLIEKKKDESSNRRSALYRINETFLQDLARKRYTTGLAWKGTEEQFIVTKDIWPALKQINATTNVFLLTTLEGLKQREDLRRDPETVHLLLETFVWEGYKTLTSKLIEASTKVIDKIDTKAAFERILQGSLREKGY